ncbi:predicted protein [Lichtheimia corymbifera JMRC:FSU:9682]|uniref:Uncharacterized protein n=1 Tax=Lichtheimia corymbifera JMRC:FSU:9682 TaxID=1263082 RepID=A0A068RR38_9FUNG|nr:predicted protein [Lichtheimia corymbifera JMRC:FSU:9682]
MKSLTCFQRMRVDLSGVDFPSFASTQYSKMLDHLISSINHDHNSHAARSHINNAVVTNIIIRPSFYLYSYPYRCSLLTLLLIGA